MKLLNLLLVFLIICICSIFADAKGVKIPSKFMRKRLEKSVRNKFLVRTPFNYDIPSMNRKQQAPLVWYHLRKRKLNIDPVKKDVMFWRKNTLDDMVMDINDLTLQAQSMALREKQLARKEVIMNKRFAAPMINQLVLSNYKGGSFGGGKSEKWQGIKENWLYPGYKKARQYYPYLSLRNRPAEGYWGVKDSSALPWFPRYHRTLKTGYAKRSDFPDLMVKLSPTDAKKSGIGAYKMKLFRMYFPERGDNTQLFEKTIGDK